MKAVFIKIHFIFKIELSVVQVCIHFWDRLYIFFHFYKQIITAFYEMYTSLVCSFIDFCKVNILLA